MSGDTRGPRADTATPTVPLLTGAGGPPLAAQAARPIDATVALTHILVVEYHTLTTEALSDSIYVLPVDTFARQMAALAASGIPVISARELGRRLAEGRDLDRDAVVITFDDGYQTVGTLAAPLLDRYRFPYTLFLIGGLIQDGPATAGPGGRLTLGALRDLEAGGLADPESHTWGLHDGCALDCVDGPALEADLQHEALWLASVGAASPTAFAYPHGSTSPASLAVIRSTYSVAFVGPRLPSGFAPADARWLYPRFIMYPTTDMGRLLQLFFQRHWVYYQ